MTNPTILPQTNYCNLVIEALADENAEWREWAARYSLAYHAAVALLADKEITEQRHREQRDRLVEENRELRATIMRADSERSAA